MTTTDIRPSENWPLFSDKSIKIIPPAIATPKQLNLQEKIKVIWATHHPFLAKYVQTVKLKDNKEVLMRPILPQDKPLITDFHKKLSEQSVYFRWFSNLPLEKRLSPESLRQECQPDFNCQVNLVAKYYDPESRVTKVLGVGCLCKTQGKDEADFALIVSDEAQGTGLGQEIIKQIIRVGQDYGVKYLVADILPENIPMQNLCKKMGFKVRYSLEDQVMKADLVLV